MKIIVLCFAMVASATLAASAATQTSISKLAFGPANTLFASDWKSGRVFAYRLPDAAKASGRPFNLTNLKKPLADALGKSDYTLDDFAMRPNSDEAYVAVSVSDAGAPAIVRLRPDGTVAKLDLAALPASDAALVDARTSGSYWHSVPFASFTVTDMKWHDGKLYVAGLSNQRFASTLRVLSYPFGQQSIASIEMYHTVHNEWETRAPIRAMTFANVGGVDTVLAAYLCSPLVAFPVAQVKNGAHIRAKTLAELGVAGIPSSMMVYDQVDMKSGKTYPFLLVNERYRPSIAISLGAIAKAVAGPGLTTPPDMMAPPAANLGGMVDDFDGVLSMDNQNSHFFVALRRNLDTGAPQLLSYDKMAQFRLSDADISEYDFPDYRYSGQYETKMILPMQNMLKTEEGFSDLVVPTPKP